MTQAYGTSLLFYTGNYFLDYLFSCKCVEYNIMQIYYHNIMFLLHKVNLFLMGERKSQGNARLHFCNMRFVNNVITTTKISMIFE